MEELVEQLEAKQIIAAEGFGLNQVQQEALVDLWRWQKQSLNSNIIIGNELQNLQE